jgi:hypothetical protein
VFTPFEELSKCLSTAPKEDSKGFPKGILKDFRKDRRLERSYDATTPSWAGSGSDRSDPVVQGLLAQIHGRSPDVSAQPWPEESPDPTPPSPS